MAASCKRNPPIRNDPIITAALFLSFGSNNIVQLSDRSWVIFSSILQKGYPFCFAKQSRNDSIYKQRRKRKRVDYINVIRVKNRCKEMKTDDGTYQRLAYV